MIPVDKISSFIGETKFILDKPDWHQPCKIKAMRGAVGSASDS